MGYSADRLPRLGKVRGREGVFIMGGFTGHGMPQVFLAAKGPSEIFVFDKPYTKTGLLKLFEEIESRLKIKGNTVLDLHAQHPPESSMV
jgi:hypothetical protein